MEFSLCGKNDRFAGFVQVCSLIRKVWVGAEIQYEYVLEVHHLITLHIGWATTAIAKKQQYAEDWATFSRFLPAPWREEEVWCSEAQSAQLLLWGKLWGREETPLISPRFHFKVSHYGITSAIFLCVRCNKTIQADYESFHRLQSEFPRWVRSAAWRRESFSSQQPGAGSRGRRQQGVKHVSA